MELSVCNFPLGISVILLFSQLSNQVVTVNLYFELCGCQDDLLYPWKFGDDETLIAPIERWDCSDSSGESTVDCSTVIKLEVTPHPIPSIVCPVPLEVPFQNVQLVTVPSTGGPVVVHSARARVAWQDSDALQLQGLVCWKWPGKTEILKDGFFFAISYIC